MMMDTLQWGGAVGVVVSYWFYISNPRLSIFFSLAGCGLAAIWAVNVPAWGILFIEVFVFGLGVRNLYKLATLPRR